MAFTDEGNFLLKDMIIRSDFRLVDAEIRVGDVTARQRVSSLLQRQLASVEIIAAAAVEPVLPPGVPPIGPSPVPPPVGGLPPVVPEEPTDIGPERVVGRQVYTVRGDSSTATVFRGPRIIADGVLVRVTGELVHTSPILSTDEGITFLVSDSDELNSIGRLGGDHDLINMGLGAPVVGDHGIGLIQEQDNTGGVNQSRWDVRFHQPVRSGQRLCVEQDVGVGLHFFAVFEVVQFSEGLSTTEVIRERVVESVRLPPAPAGFTPVMMQHSILPPVVVQSLASFQFRFALGYQPVGNVLSSGVSLI